MFHIHFAENEKHKPQWSTFLHNVQSLTTFDKIMNFQSNTNYFNYPNIVCPKNVSINKDNA